jgi:hypothetical protein
MSEQQQSERQRLSACILTKLKDREINAKYWDAVLDILSKAGDVAYNSKGKCILDTGKIASTTLCSIYSLVCYGQNEDDDMIYRRVLSRLNSNANLKAVQDSIGDYRAFRQTWSRVLPNSDDAFILHFISNHDATLQSVRSDYLSMRFVLESLMACNTGSALPSPERVFETTTVRESFDAYKRHMRATNGDVESFISQHIATHFQTATELKKKFTMMRFECLRMMSQVGARVDSSSGSVKKMLDDDIEARITELCGIRECTEKYATGLDNLVKMPN